MGNLLLTSHKFSSILKSKWEGKMNIIIPEDENNNKIAFDFSDCLADVDKNLWSYFFTEGAQEEIFAYERKNPALSTDGKERFIEELCTNVLKNDMLNNYVLILRKDCIDHRFKNMTNKSICFVLENKFFKIKDLDIFKNTANPKNIDRMDPLDRYKYAIMHESMHKNPEYTVHHLPKGGSINITTFLWESVVQTISYHEEIGITPLGENDKIIRARFRGATFVKRKLQEKQKYESSKKEEKKQKVVLLEQEKMQ